MTVPAPRRPGILKRLSAALGFSTPAPRLMLAPAKASHRNYAAAQMSRLTEGWSAINYSASAELQTSLDILRGRSRQLCRDNGYARRFLKLCDTNIVGPQGFRHQARIYNSPGQPDTPANTAVEAAFADWSTQCDAAGQLNLRSISSLLVLSAARDGEYLARIVRGKDAGNPYQIALQVLDVDRLDTAFSRSASEGQNQIRMGVEVNPYGRPVAYYLRNQAINDPYASGRTERQRIPADDIIHGFIRERAEQFRGVPWMHASAKDLSDLGGYREAAIVASRVGASSSVYLTKTEGAAEVEGAGLATEQDDGTMQMEVDAGTVNVLPEGYDMKSFEPDYPAAMYESFVKATLRGISSGFGVAYHALSGDLEGVSFSSIRSGTLEERDQWECLQQWFVEGFLERLYPEWLKNALTFGLVTFTSGSTLPASKFDKAKAHVFIGRRWDWVDPLRDIQADIAAMDAGLISPQAIVAKMRGTGDYEDTLIEIKAAEDLRAKIGVAPRAPAAAKPGKPSKPAANDGAAAPDEDEEGAAAA